MRFSLVIAVAAFVSSASASLISRQGGLPQCAFECITKADLGGCQATDNNCLCRSDTFLNSSTNCIGQTCKGQDLEDATAAARQLCAIVGVTLTSTPAGFPTLTGTLTGGTATAAGANTASGTAGGATPSGSSAASINGVSTVASIAALGLAALVL
ncbi:hypothetical protein D9756_008564 [Leucocoprinus leucothites]|uniref:CFEM domain-containing protein n=1 Tax=Leucocoprinus leucothites TaxID=201217 RepID=A0A8H5FVW9_9AGAR|nr:hypothetical protein D9756_008564 [Leucoagaricus leucothites]